MKLGKRSVNVVISNPTNSPITLEKGHILGAVESVSAIIPISPAETQKEQSANPANPGAKHESETTGEMSGEYKDGNPESPPVVTAREHKMDINKVEATTTPMFDLSHLSEEHRTNG